MYYDVLEKGINKTIDTDKDYVILSMMNVLSYQCGYHEPKFLEDDIATVVEAYGRYRIKFDTPRNSYSERLKKTLTKACGGCKESSELLYEYACAYLGLEIGESLLSDDYDPEEDCVFSITDDLEIE